MQDEPHWPSEFERVALAAVACSVCFEDLGVERATVDRAQPRWIGPRYRTAARRLGWVLAKPGSGAGRHDGADERFLDCIRGFAAGQTNLREIMEHQRRDIPNWGRGRFLRYLDLAGVDLDEIALLNIAWCATAGNAYPLPMLKRCFGRHTADALVALDPHVVVLAGSAAQPFATAIKARLPNVHVLPTLSYAHREGDAATLAAAAELRDRLASVP